jgi:hypothetical protein
MQPLSHSECKGHLKRLTDDWLAGQIQHHERNSKRHGHLHHEVERLAWALFLIVAFAAVLHLGHPKFGCFNPATWLYILCVCVPVMIASVHGMASQLESNRLHLRSDSLRQLLETSKERLDVLKDKEGSTTLEATLSELSISDGAGTTGVAAEVTVSATCAGGLTAADWRFVQAEALHAASLMIDETAAWSLLYKNAAIPAG